MAFRIGFLERYWASHEWETIQKSRSVKYIRRYPKKNGKGWNYVYADSWKHPLQALLECFGIKKKKIDDDYANANIKEDYGADRQTFAAHVLEYFTNKVKWDSIFSKKETRDKYKKPVTQKAVEAKAAAVAGEKKAPKAESGDKMTVNRSLMRKVWGIYSVEGQRVEAAEKHEENNSEFLNNLEKASQAYNKKRLTKPDMIKKPIAQIARFANANTNGIDEYKTLDEYVAYLTEASKSGLYERLDFENVGRDFARIANKETARGIFEAYENGEYELDTNGILQKRDTSALSEAMMGNQNAKGNKGGDGGNGNGGNTFKFSSLTESEKKEFGKKITGSVVSEIGKDTVEYNGDGRFDKAAKEWIKNNPQGNAESFIGEIVINEKSVARDMHHGDKADQYLKLQTLPCVKDILEKGTYMGYESDFDKKNIDNHYFAGKIKYGDDEKIVFCRVRENAGDTNRFYVHEVFTEDEIKKETSQATVVDGSLPRLTGKSLYQFILQDVLNVKEKAQTDKELKAEKEMEKAARLETGLPEVKEEFGERTSLSDDLSWNPNDENYRYKDTGYIAGARKELALSMIKLAGKNKERLRDTDIDWKGVEENKRAAKEVITKSNVFGQVDWETLRAGGMTGGAAFLIDRVYSMIGKEPKDDNAEARRQYVIALNGLRDRLETAKTVQDVENSLNEIADELNGKFHSVRDTDDYKERYSKVSELAKKVREVRNKSGELYNAYNTEQYAAREREDKRLRKFLSDNKAIQWNKRWYSDKDLDKLSPEKRKEFEELKEQVHKEEFAKSEELYAEYEKFQEENGKLKGSSKYVYPDGSYTYINYQIEKEKLDAEQNLSLWEQVQGAKAILENPLYRAWYQLGDKFQIITKSAWKSKTFYQHKADARRGKYDDWEWLKKDNIEVSKKGEQRKVKFEFLVAKEYERKGGRNVTAKSTQELKELFNLRDVQSGNWVLNDPESAKFHVDRMAESFADLCDVTGIPDSLVSLNGRLAVAIGARGNGGKGAANAHYESVERVINITKMKGGGSLGHEWFHAFDNMIMEAMGGGDGKSGTFMTNKYAHLNKTQKQALQEYFLAESGIRQGLKGFAAEYRLEKAKRDCAKKGVSIPESPKEQFQLKVAGAFDKLVETMTGGNTPLLEKLTYSEADWNSARWNIKPDATGLGKQIYDAKNLVDAMKAINKRFGGSFSKNRAEWARMAAAYYNGKPDGYNTIIADLGRKGSDFFQKAKLMDGGTQEYWSEPHEMAARAFSAYLDDKLRENGRFNDYLANYTENKYYKSPFGDMFPYPEGEERKSINNAFEELFRIVAEEKAIRKSLAMIDDTLMKSIDCDWDSIEKIHKNNAKNNISKAWCLFDRNGNLYFRKSAFAKKA